MQPRLYRRDATSTRRCARCNGTFGISEFTPTKAFWFPDGFLPVCNDCIEVYLKEQDFDWAVVNKLCQCADIPWVPREFERLHKDNGPKVFPVYAKVFTDKVYEDIGWEDYFQAFKQLKEQQRVEDELPGLREEKMNKLRAKWGANYDDEALNYLEGLYSGLLQTQNVNGALQGDQAVKICKISYELDCRIREGQDFDKILTAYDKLVKTAEFTPKNVKNASDFDSIGELASWLEKRGWKAKYYDGVTKDVVDETMQNIQAFNQRLYTNESGIGEQIAQRLEALQNAHLLEVQGSKYGDNEEFDLEQYNNDGFEGLLKDDDFSAEVD